MSFSETGEESSVYQRLREWLFSGNVAPGTKLTERKLAREFGVSHIPVREALRLMVGQGLLVGGRKGEGVRTRTYTPEEIQRLSEFREILECGAARSAAANATETDLTRLEMICDEFEAAISERNLERWNRLDRHFHAALAEASHNKRLIHGLDHLLTECHYVFFVRPARIQSEVPCWSRKSLASSSTCIKSKKPGDEVTMADVAEEHRALVETIRAGDGDRADVIARSHIWAIGRRAAREAIASDMEK